MDPPSSEMSRAEAGGAVAQWTSGYPEVDVLFCGEKGIY